MSRKNRKCINRKLIPFMPLPQSVAEAARITDENISDLKAKEPTLSDAYLDFFRRTTLLETLCPYYTELTKQAWGHVIPPCSERCSERIGNSSCKHDWVMTYY